MIACVSNMKASSSRFAIPASQNLRIRQQRDREEDDDVINPYTSLVQSELISTPKVPPPSQAFSSALYKLRFGATTGKVVGSDEIVTTGGSESCCRGILTSSNRNNNNSPKQRRTVHFDEATITSTAEFGETAARFRSLSRNKRQSRTPSPPENSNRQQQAAAGVCFGGCRNITVTYNDDDVITSVDELTQFTAVATSSPSFSSGKKQRSIFDACDNVFTYTGIFS